MQMKNANKPSGSTSKRINVFNSASKEYHAAFKTFLACTDQKEKAMAHLEHELTKLPRRTTFVDVGAGTGKLTAHFAPKFKATIAIEPNPSLISELRTNCPDVTILE